jgi:hypothetical protein
VFYTATFWEFGAICPTKRGAKSVAMPHFFVRVCDAGRLLPDDGEAQAFENLEQVLHEAISSARELLSRAVLIGKAGNLNQQIHVFDEVGKTVLIMPVGRATDTESQD